MQVAAIAEVDRVLKDDIEEFGDCVDAIEAGRESRGLWRCLGGAGIFPAEVILSSGKLPTENLFRNNLHHLPRIFPQLKVSSALPYLFVKNSQRSIKGEEFCLIDS